MHQADYIYDNDQILSQNNNNNKKDEPIPKMTPKQVTHVRIRQRLLLIAQQPQRTSV